MNLTFSRGALGRAAIAALGAMIALGACSSAGADTAAQIDTAAQVDTADRIDTADELYVFDSSQVHTISVQFDEAEYDALIQTYLESGDKDWIEATVTIDGVTYEQVGVRLKGNSSLRGGPGESGQSLADEQPEDLPWLIRLDKYVDGQNHQGIYDLVVRSNNTTTALNEAVALELLDAAGLASQDAASIRFSVNGSEEVLRLVVEHPDDVWMTDEFSEDGALYKAESTGDYSYRGTDPESYNEVFDQEAGDANADLTPLIEFLDFINNSDDATFAAELESWLDIDSFATYLAMQDLIGNFDDIDGPGNNSYLYYDTDTGIFTVVPWDHNLAFGVLNGGAGGFGGALPGAAGRGDRPTPPDGATDLGDAVVPPGRVDGGALGDPGDAAQDQGDGVELQPPGGGAGFAPAAGQADGGFPAAGGPREGSNVLSERFRAVGEFADLYEQAKTNLAAELFDGGVAQEILDSWVNLLESQAGDLVDSATIGTEASAIAAKFV